MSSKDKKMVATKQIRIYEDTWAFLSDKIENADTRVKPSVAEFLEEFLKEHSPEYVKFLEKKSRG